MASVQLRVKAMGKRVRTPRLNLTGIATSPSTRSKPDTDSLREQNCKRVEANKLRVEAAAAAAAAAAAGVAQRLLAR